MPQKKTSLTNRSPDLSAAGADGELRIQPELTPKARILFCTWGYPPAPTGGAEQQAHLQARALTRLGYSVHVVCPAWPGTKSGVHEGIAITRLPLMRRPRVTVLSYMASLLWYLLRHGAEFDLFHVHLGFAQTDIVGLVAAMYRRPMWVKLAASGSLGEIQRMRHVARITRHLGLRSAARVQAISDPIRVEALAVGVSPQRLIRIPNGVDANRFRPPETKREKDDARKVLELPTGADIVLYVGRIARHKGIDDLLDAWRLIQSDGRLLVLVGSTETIDPADNPSAPRLILVGWSDRPELYYRAADMLVLPSHIEGMSNALLEAMSSGLAVVSSRIGAAEELIDPSVTGELVDVGDSDSLRRVVDELLADAPRRMRLGSAARATVVERYSIDAVALEISRGYDALT